MKYTIGEKLGILKPKKEDLSKKIVFERCSCGCFDCYIEYEETKEGRISRYSYIEKEKEINCCYNCYIDFCDGIEREIQ